MTQKLPRTAYELKPGEEYTPLTKHQSLAEFTTKAIVSGILLGMLFGAANTYLGLKAGLTISTSIPIAVLTVVVFRVLAALGFKYSILETNTSQTIGSASSSVASGALFTIPALFMWGMTPSLLQLTLLCMSGGILGILAMIPLRRFLIAKEHGKLPYPEGMACAEVLVASESGGDQAKGVFAGIGIGMLFKILTDGLKVIPGTFHAALPLPAKATVATSVSPALIGVGYILGIRVASVMVAGAALTSLIIIPAIFYIGRGWTEPLFPEPETLIRDMSPGQIWNRYIRYIGAGAVATGGMITLIKSLPTMVESFRMSLKELSKSSDEVKDRTETDLAFPIVGGVALLVIAVLIFVPGILGSIDSVMVRGVAAVLAAVFAFFFVTVSSRIVGLVGQTSNPVSGMTIASLLGTSIVFYFLGWTDDMGRATALMVGSVICIAASIAGDTSQDLKTGYILGATPKWQQTGELIGCITSATVVCWVLLMLDQNIGLGSKDLPAPQATLMRLVVEGVLDQNLPWLLLGIGVVIALIVAALRLPVLAFAVGVYLPLDTMAAIFVGGLLRWFLTRPGATDEATSESRRERGILFGSGLVGGGGLTGVVLAMVVTFNGGKKITGFSEQLSGLSDFAQQGMALVAVLAIAGLLGWWAIGGKAKADSTSDSAS